eukprot:g2115.t1
MGAWSGVLGLATALALIYWHYPDVAARRRRRLLDGRGSAHEAAGEGAWESIPLPGDCLFSYRVVGLDGDSSIPELRLNIPSALASFVALGVSPGDTAGSKAFTNFMTGPPHSEAVVGLGSEVGLIVLDGMPPSRVDFSTGNVSLDVALGTTNHNASLTRTTVSGTTLQFRASRVGTWPLPINSSVNIIYAYGNDEDDASGTGNKISYHSRARRGILKDLNLSQGTSSTGTPIPYYELHGGFLSFIWSVTTLLGGVFARYFRSWPGWVDAHQFLQTIASVLSFPLTILSYVSKDGKESHYNSIHGVIGLIFSVSASAQGFIGTYVHMTFVHEYACVSQKHRLMAHMRCLHRALGKILLAVAVLQISLGLGQYDAEIWSRAARGDFNLAAAFLLYTSLAWASIAVLEYRHRRFYQRGRTCFGFCGGRGHLMHTKNFHPITGAGYCSEADLRANTNLYVNAVNIIDQIMEIENVSDPWACIQAWVQQGGQADVGSAAKFFGLPMRLVYFYGHRSMKTGEILDYSRFLEKHFGEDGQDEMRSRGSVLQIDAYRGRIHELLKAYGVSGLDGNSAPAMEEDEDEDDGVATWTTKKAVALTLEMTPEVEVEL